MSEIKRRVKSLIESKSCSSSSLKISFLRRLTRIQERRLTDESSPESEPICSRWKRQVLEDMELKFNENLKYIVDIEDIDTTVADAKYSKRLGCLVQDMSKHSYTNTKLLTFVEYYKVGMLTLYLTQSKV